MKSSTTGIIVFFLVLAGCIVVAACNTRKDYSAEVRRLDSLAILMDSSMASLQRWTKVEARADSASAHIQFIQENYQGTMPQTMAKELNLYGLMRKDMYSLAEFSQTLRNQLDSGRKQVLDLRQALVEGATHDAKDNKLTEDYVRSSVKKEEQSADELLSLAKRQKEKSFSLQWLYSESQPQIKMWMDSIQLKSVK